MKSDAFYLAFGDVFGLLDVNQVLLGSVLAKSIGLCQQIPWQKRKMPQTW